MTPSPFLRISFFLGALLFCASLLAQEDKYWVRFTDKSGTPYSVEEPLEFLSEAAVERRKKQGVPIDREDLPVDPSYRDSILAHPSVELLHSSRWFNAITVHCPDSVHMDTVSDLGFVKGSRKVKSFGVADLDGAGKKELVAREREKSMRKTGQKKGPGAASRQLSMMGLDHLHALGYKGEGIRIAVLDAGFPGVKDMKGFADLFEEARYIGGLDAVEGDGSPFHAHPHGRSVLSILAGQKKGLYRGSAVDASYILCRTENASSEHRVEEHNWVAAAEFADSAGADILTTSLGYTIFDDSSDSYDKDDMDGNTAMITRGADIAASKGILVVNSAGNYGASSWGIVGAPADGDRVMAVGSVDSNSALSDFSSRGPTSDGRIKPELLAMGEGTAYLGGDGAVYRGNGTSFSAPLISGGAACLWSAHPDLSAMELFDLMLENASQYSQPDNERGYGVPDLYSAYLEEKGLSKAEGGKRRLLRVAPNPFSEHVEVHFFSGSSKEVSFAWYDVMGRQLSQEEHAVDPYHHHEFRLQAPDKKGVGAIYLLRVRWKNGPVRTRRILREEKD